MHAPIAFTLAFAFTFIFLTFALFAIALRRIFLLYVREGTIVPLALPLLKGEAWAGVVEFAFVSR